MRKWMKRLSSLTFIGWHKMRQIFSLILWTSLFLCTAAVAVNFTFNSWPFYESSRSLVSTEKYHCWIIHCFPFQNVLCFWHVSSIWNCLYVAFHFTVFHFVWLRGNNKHLLPCHLNHIVADLYRQNYRKIYCWKNSKKNIATSFIEAE